MATLFLASWRPFGFSNLVKITLMGNERDFTPVQFCDKKFVPFLTTKVTDFRTAGPMGDQQRKGEPRVHDDIRVLYLSPLALR